MKPKLVMILCLLRSNASAFATPSAKGVGAKVIKSNRRNLLPFSKRTAVTLVDDDDTDSDGETSTSLHATSQKSSYYNTQQSQPQLLNSGHIAFRLARRTDVQQIQNCNLATLPENYNANFYINHMRSWPELTLVAEHIPEGYDLEFENNNRDDSSRITPLRDYMRTKQQQNRDIDRPQKEIVGYILGKVEERPLIPQRRIFPNSQQNNVPLYNNNYYDEEETLLQYMNNGNGNNGVRFPSSRRGGRGRPPRPPTEKIGHITSLAVHNHARRLGIAKSLLHQLHFHLQECYDSTSIGLHVRISNKAAVQLYIDEGYDVADIIPLYYGDGEDAYFMRKDFDTIVSEEIPSRSAEPKQWRRGERERNEMLNRDTNSGSFFDGRSSMRDTLTEEERAWLNTNPQQASPAANNNMVTRNQSTLSGQFKRGFRTFFNGGEQMQVRRQVNQWSKPCWETGPEGLRLPRYARVMRSIPSPETQVTDSAPNGKNFSLKDLVSNQDEENYRYEEEVEGVEGSDVARVASGPIL